MTMKLPYAAALLAATALAAPAMAQTAWIDGSRVTVMPAPTCDAGVPWPSAVTSRADGTPGTVEIQMGTQNGSGTDPFARYPALAGKSPYLTLPGQHGQIAAAVWQFATPQRYVQILWGSPDGRNGARSVCRNRNDRRGGHRRGTPSDPD